MIRLNTAISLEYFSSDVSTFFLNIQPVANQHQRVVEESLSISPPIAVMEYSVPITTNRMLKFEAGPGPIQVDYQGVIDIYHRLDEPTQLFESMPSQWPAECLPYVFPSRYCESDLLMPFALSEFGHLPSGHGRVNAICSWVQTNVTFTSGASNWTTSATHTFSNRVGVCRDFAHLMIAICRALNIPARYVTGIDYGADPALGPHDFHAYVEVFLGEHWYLFDPSGASLKTGLLRIGTGRDAADTSFAHIFGSVQSMAPSIVITAAENVQLGIDRPESIALELAVSTMS
jgi:transglutaminase-like putative cysteine protease